MSQYVARHTGLLQKAGTTPESLPDDLAMLIGKFQRAANTLQEVGTHTQEQLLSILVQTDAVICAALYCLYKDRLQLTDIMPANAPAQEDTARLDKIKLLALKAKALQLKTKRGNKQ